VPESFIVQVYRGPDDMRSIEADGEIRSDLFPGWSMIVRELLPKILRPQARE
jgi:hypothetical protein